MRLTANWTVKHKGKRYESGETIYVDEEQAARLLSSGACRYYDGPDAGKVDEAAQKANGKPDKKDRSVRLANEAKLKAGDQA